MTVPLYRPHKQTPPPPSPGVGPGAVSAPFALLSVAGALPTPLAVVAVAHHGTVFVLLAFALIIFKADAMAILGAGLDLVGQASGARLPLTKRVGVALLQWHTRQQEEAGNKC